MKKSILKGCVSAATVASVSLFAVPAFAQNAAPAADSANDGAKDEIVVTAAVGDKTAQKSSISVSQISQDTIVNFTPRSQAEVLRTIPGLNLQDTAGPGGNSNIGVRGIPVSTGGSEYVGLQEDGLPVVLFGDMQFGNNDYWVRFDNSVDRVEAVRGGSASTFSSQAPGAVINYVSKTGDKDGGEIGVSTALNYNEFRLDFDYGAHLSDSTRFHIGGFVVDGNGPTHLGYKAEKGYQIKANITHEFADNRGYIRLNFKRLDDQEPTFTSMPALVNLSGTKVTGFGMLGNIDPRKYASTGIYDQTFQILNQAGAIQNVSMQGIHPKATAVGAEFHYNVSDTISVTDKFRWTDMSGVFSNQWTGEMSTASIIGKTIGSAFGTGGAGTAVINSIRYAAGPKQGQLYTGNFISNSAQAYTSMNDVGSLANDLALSGKFQAGAGTIKANAGWFHMRQTIKMDWRINNVTQALESNNDNAPLDLFDAAGNQLTANGLTGFNNQWGGCCGGRSYDVSYTDDAPYLQLQGEFGGLDLDASVRFDHLKATGTSYAGVQGANVTVTDALGSASIPTFNTSTVAVDRLNYSKSYTSWSFGALYSLSNNTSLFARVSRGGRFNADRQLYSGNFNADGSLNAGGNHRAVNFVSQQEVGLKQRGDVGAGRYHAELTFYRAQVQEANYDFTRQQNIDTVYHSYGVEASGGLKAGGFGLDGYVVYTHARDTKTGLTPVAMPQWTWLVSPSYDAGIAQIGLSASGQSNFLTAGYTVPGRTFVNGYVKVHPMEALELGINANNLFNTIGFRANNGFLPVVGPVAGLTSTQGVFDNSAMLGRTFTATIKYHF
ncbi:MAG: TonB-dependent receptor [Proteobacteria bacterium]|nr:TonB-dependent receptor [Pseudomonadota bacterium]